VAVKKIRLDFSKVEERSGWNTRGMPEGLHKMKVESVQETEASDGTDMLVFALRPEGKYKTRLFPFYCKLQQNQYWKLRDLLVAAGVSVPKKAGQIDPNAVVGKWIAAEVEDETGQYAGRSSINGTYDLSILDDDGSAGDPDDDDEEYDEEADEDEVDEEDEDEDGLGSMTLPELRKLA
jgi:phosphopantothenoylcysteine synthetase/decarboxylase